MFEQVGEQEIEFLDGTSDPYFPTFGAKDAVEDVVREFYAYWASFASRKTFAFAEKYNPNDVRLFLFPHSILTLWQDSYNRQIKRAIEKENKKARDTARKEYNETVRVRLFLYFFPFPC